jgi:predicted ATPase
MGLATNAQSVTRLFRGDVIEAEKHFASGEAALLDQGLRRSFVGTWTISLLGWNAWIMGRADEARARARRAIAEVADDEFASATVRMVSSYLNVMLREPGQAALQAAQAIATADEHGFREVGWWARMSDAWAHTQLGHRNEGARRIGEALSAYRANGSRLWGTFFLTWLAEAQALDGALVDGLRTLEEALTVNPLEGVCRPETLRVRGEIRRGLGQEEQAEADFHAAIALAREMSAKAWELRAALSLARLWRDHRRRAGARGLLAPIYGWFTEGFDTADLKDARALLEELA